jgi:hypothetical protein
MIPEVVKLVQDSGVGAKSGQRSVQSDLVSWCFLNELKSQSLQFIKLCAQNVSNVWRKRSFDKLLSDVQSGAVRLAYESELKKGQNSSYVSTSSAVRCFCERSADHASVFLDLVLSPALWRRS